MINRWRGWRLPVLVGFVIAGIGVLGRESGLARRSADFTIAYSAALLIREGRAEDVYRPDQLGPLMLRLSDSAIDPRLPFDAPLASALPVVPLTLLPLEARSEERRVGKEGRTGW